MASDFDKLQKKLDEAGVSKDDPARAKGALSIQSSDDVLKFALARKNRRKEEKPAAVAETKPVGRTAFQKLKDGFKTNLERAEIRAKEQNR